MIRFGLDQERIRKWFRLLLFILALVAFWCIRTVNDFRKKEIRVQESLSGVEVALTKRYDMLVKMLDIAKG